jgi:hypothetical protein
MSSDIWTRCAGSSEIAPLATTAWRVVESQHQISTRKLVASDADQHLLEEVLERYKPPALESSHLHYLLFTPFRYPPLSHGSRFGTRAEPGIWYGAETPRTAFAEVAYYRLLFLEGTEASLGPLMADLTAYQVPVRTERGIDLTMGPFSRHSRALTSKTSYAATQPLGVAMRDAGVEAFRFASARDEQGGINVGVFAAAAFGARRPRGLQTWRSVATPEIVEFSRRDYFEREGLQFARAQFLVDGALPDVGERSVRR